MAMLEFINISKQYGDVTALEPMDLVLDAEKTYVLLGTSGCGKSTLLKVALGLVKTDTGSVRFDGEELNDKNALRIRQRVGYVIQDGGLFPHLTARDNVSLVARYLDWKRTRIDSRLGELAVLTQLPSDCLDRYPAQLSGGQQQRVGLMRALFLDPELLLMDEPLGALDPIIRRDLQSDLRAIFRSLNKTVVLVTHDVREAVYLADDILLLRSGSVVQRGAPRELLDSPTDPYVTQFIRAQLTTLTGDES
ncbi:MAG: ATP-binding cassette domain-containing protein [Pirellulaceae bacterium]